jgi:hypothetical protein
VELTTYGYNNYIGQENDFRKSGVVRKLIIFLVPQKAKPAYWTVPSKLVMPVKKCPMLLLLCILMWIIK